MLVTVTPGRLAVAGAVARRGGGDRDGRAYNLLTRLIKSFKEPS